HWQEEAELHAPGRAEVRGLPWHPPRRFKTKRRNRPACFRKTFNRGCSPGLPCSWSSSCGSRAARNQRLHRKPLHPLQPFCRRSKSTKPRSSSCRNSASLIRTSRLGELSRKAGGRHPRRTKKARVPLAFRVQRCRELPQESDIIARPRGELCLESLGTGCKRRPTWRIVKAIAATPRSRCCESTGNQEFRGRRPKGG